MKQNTVLICGAGPSGLIMALWLKRSGIDVRLIDKSSGPGTTSRATVFHARNLEFYRQLGIDQIVLDQGIPFTAANIWVKGVKKGYARFGDTAAEISPYPYAFIFPQDLHENMLVELLEKEQVIVERQTELLHFQDDGQNVTYTLRHGDGTEEAAAAKYLAGCDGAHSTIRKQLGISFPGEIYANTFYVADLKISGPLANGEMHVALDAADFLAVFPMKGEGRVRLIGAIRPGSDAKKELSWNDVGDSVLQRLKFEVSEVRWFSTYRVHHRVAERFQQGNVFLAGDAGHLHSPVGGQGMNTGIGDAINLAWKIAAVEQGKNDRSLLDSYSRERVPFAISLVRTTDKVFSFLDKRGPLARFVRSRVAPLVIPRLTRLAWFRRNLYLIISQVRITYRHTLSENKSTARWQPGDRLPWVRLGASDNFAPLKSRDWQVHVYGEAGEGLIKRCQDKNYALHRFPWTEAMRKAGLERNVAYLVRPDGYLGHMG